VTAWVSLILHLVIVLGVVEGTRGALAWDPLLEDRVGSDLSRGGGGGREVTMIHLTQPPTAATAVLPVSPPPTVPALTATKVQPVLPPPSLDTLPLPAQADTPTGAGGGSGGGSGTGSGPGTGLGSGPGPGGAAAAVPPEPTRAAGRPPEPRQLILPPFDYPKVMRGRTVAVTFFVLADGSVDRVVFSEDIPDRGYAKKLEDVMRAYRFRPARSAAGAIVPGVTTVSISF
jgi:hypothetical protein